MTTPMPHPQVPGPRPAAPLPGQHLPGANQAAFAEPEKVRAEIDALLAELAAGARDSEIDGTDLTRRARILEQAHEVLVQALATVDKI
ncbi:MULTISPECIES: hypothetical protein [Nocardia]|uniref:Uncharacterized protein n=1 Tax=Nocardia arthritidis TaxID=228602 RepID=A0A6G9YDI3_9NOCA|nr:MULTISPECIES: hypothetical protein [Nocardia]QIS11289.1 hypothetical protein F5544_17065 [Nocardia arthritidis]